MNLGQSIRHLRINKAKQGQGVFAQNIGITQTYLSQIENGIKTPSTGVLKNIANYLKIPLPILFWYSITDDDVEPDKQHYYRLLKPIIDVTLKMLF